MDSSSRKQNQLITVITQIRQQLNEIQKILDEAEENNGFVPSYHLQEKEALLKFLSHLQSKLELEFANSEDCEDPAVKLTDLMKTQFSFTAKDREVEMEDDGYDEEEVEVDDAEDEDVETEEDRLDKFCKELERFMEEENQNEEEEAANDLFGQLQSEETVTQNSPTKAEILELIRLTENTNL